MSDITVRDLKDKYDRGEETRIVDVREPYEHEEFNIGGENLPLGNIQTWMGDIEEWKEEEVVVYCRSGNRSSMAVAFLAAAGFKNVRNLQGGVEAWQEAFPEETN